MATNHILTSEEHGRMTVHTRWSTLNGRFQISWKEGDTNITVIDETTGNKTPIEVISVRKIMPEKGKDAIWTNEHFVPYLN